jgi:SsrA-binding protein
MSQQSSKLFLQDLAFNKRASFDYQVLDALEAGMVLTGGETKSAKLGHIHLNGAFVVPHGTELFLVNCLIEPYQSNEVAKEAKTRSIKLLLKKKEIAYLSSRIKASGLTLIPLKVYNKRGLVKVEVALAKGKKSYDKRETIKKRDDLARIHRGED